jgi:hypothetical protein
MALRQIVLKELPELQEVAGMLVSKDLEGMLKGKSLELARAKAEAVWKRRAKEKPGSDAAGVKWAEVGVLSSLSLGTLFDGDVLQLSKVLRTAKKLPPALLTHYTNLLHPFAISQLKQRYKELQKDAVSSARAVFVDKHHARFAVNLRGLQSIADASLRSKLALDLLQHVRDSVPGGLEKLEAALLEDPEANLQPLQDLEEALRRQGTSAEEQLRDIERAFRSFPDSQLSVDVFPKKKASMMREMTTQLQNSNDLSLSLLLTLLLLLGKRGDGIIRATG